MNYYKRYMGDYQRDTGHLSLVQHGAYTVLLDHYYSTRAPLPADLDALCRLCRAITKEERAAVGFIADAYFPVAADGLRHNLRADAELGKWNERAAHNRTVGKGGGRPRKEPGRNPDGFPDRNPEETRTVSGLEPATEPAENPLQKPEARKISTPTSAHSSETSPPRAREVRKVPRETDPDPDWWLDVKLAYPSRAGSQNWRGGLKAATARLREGHSADDLLAGAKRYAAYIRAKGDEGTEFVQQASRFFGPDKPFLEPWALPAERRGQPAKLSAVDQVRQATGADLRALVPLPKLPEVGHG